MFILQNKNAFQFNTNFPWNHVSGDRPSTPDDTLGDGKDSKVKDWLRLWITKRPTKESLRQSGIFKGESIN